MMETQNSIHIPSNVLNSTFVKGSLSQEGPGTDPSDIPVSICPSSTSQSEVIYQY